MTPVHVTVRYGFLKLRVTHFDIYDYSGRVFVKGELPKRLYNQFVEQVRRLFVSPTLRQSGLIPVIVVYNQYTGRYAFILGIKPDEYPFWEQHLNLLLQAGLNTIDMRRITEDSNGVMATIAQLEPALRDHVLRIGRHVERLLDEAELARLAYSAGVPIGASPEDRLIGIALALTTLVSRQQLMELGTKLFLQRVNSSSSQEAAWERFLRDSDGLDFDDHQAIAQAYIKAGFTHAPCCDGKNPDCLVEQEMQRQLNK